MDIVMHDITKDSVDGKDDEEGPILDSSIDVSTEELKNVFTNDNKNSEHHSGMILMHASTKHDTDLIVTNTPQKSSRDLSSKLYITSNNSSGSCAEVYSSSKLNMCTNNPSKESSTCSKSNAEPHSNLSTSNQRKIDIEQQQTSTKHKRKHLGQQKSSKNSMNRIKELHAESLSRSYNQFHRHPNSNETTNRITTAEMWDSEIKSGKQDSTDGKETDRTSNIDESTRSHTNVTLFACGICGEEFSKSGNFHSHLRKHTGELSDSTKDVSYKHTGELSDSTEDVSYKTDETLCAMSVLSDDMGELSNCNDKTSNDLLETSDTKNGKNSSSDRTSDMWNESLDNNGDSSSSDETVSKDIDMDDEEYKSLKLIEISKGSLENLNKSASDEELVFDKPYKCDVCHKRFKRKGDMVSHRRIHTGDKPYRCDVCDKRFRQRADLNSHFRIHTGDKPYTCDVCGKEFTRIDYLQKHHRTHTGEQPYTCPICNQKFSEKGNLQKHVSRHAGDTTFNCDVCGKAFNQKCNLLIHHRIHTGERPYKCEDCGKAFRHKGTLKMHVLIHTGIKPYTCEVCGKGFRQRGGLRNHCAKHSEKMFLYVL